MKATGCRLAMEPGRVIAGNAGILVSRVLYTKQSGEKRFLIQDAAMNDLIRPALYESFHRIWPVAVPAGLPAPPDDFEAAIAGTEPWDVVGPVCESGDFLAKDRALPPLDRGDLLAIFSAGAYGMVMASNYNTRPRAAEVLVDGAAARLVRRRETSTTWSLQERARRRTSRIAGPDAPLEPANRHADSRRLRPRIEADRRARCDGPDPMRRDPPLRGRVASPCAVAWLSALALLGPAPRPSARPGPRPRELRQGARRPRWSSGTRPTTSSAPARPSRRSRTSNAFLKAKPDDATLLQIRDRYGVGSVLRLDDDPATRPLRQAARSTGSAAGRAAERDPARADRAVHRRADQDAARSRTTPSSGSARRARTPCPPLVAGPGQPGPRRRGPGPDRPATWAGSTARPSPP